METTVTVDVPTADQDPASPSGLTRAAEIRLLQALNDAGFVVMDGPTAAPEDERLDPVDVALVATEAARAMEVLGADSVSAEVGEALRARATPAGIPVVDSTHGDGDEATQGP